MTSFKVCHIHSVIGTLVNLYFTYSDVAITETNTIFFQPEIHFDNSYIVIEEHGKTI